MVGSSSPANRTPSGIVALGGIGRRLAEDIERREDGGEPVIYQRLGYLMRSGPPDALDRLVAHNFGNLAADLLESGETGRLTAIIGGRYRAVPITVLGEGVKRVDVDRFYDTAWNTNREWSRWPGYRCSCTDRAPPKSHTGIKDKRARPKTGSWTYQPGQRLATGSGTRHRGAAGWSSCRAGSHSKPTSNRPSAFMSVDTQFCAMPGYGSPAMEWLRLR